jgi:hypothetical protein
MHLSSEHTYGVEKGSLLTISAQESFIKLGFHLIMFFFYLYSMIGKIYSNVKTAVFLKELKLGRCLESYQKEKRTIPSPEAPPKLSVPTYNTSKA